MTKYFPIFQMITIQVIRRIAQKFRHLAIYAALHTFNKFNTYRIDDDKNICSKIKTKHELHRFNYTDLFSSRLQYCISLQLPSTT